MKKFLALLVPAALVAAAATALAATPVMVQDYEKASSLPKVWVVGIPNENASVQLSTEHPFEGRQCLKLHYHFTGGGQYLGILNTVKIQAPIHKMRFMVYGDGSGSGYGLYLTDASGETHKYRDAASMKIDFKGWKEIVVDLDRPHESWGGDRNGKLDYPIKEFLFEVSTPGSTVEGNVFFDAVGVDSDASAEETLSDREIAVVSPDYCSAVKGDTKIVLSAPAFKTAVARCWKQGPGFGADSTVAQFAFDAQGRGSFVFPADQYPHGPLCVTITGEGKNFKDNCYLQLYNKGGVSWNEGMPKDAPPAAQGMSLLFADDFSGPLSIGGDNTKATYYDHKPPHGWQDFSFHPFTDHQSPKDPFAQVDTYLRIRASDQLHSAGLICSVKSDGSGVKATVPCYFEARFIGPNAVGAWPAFWLLTDNLSNANQPCDELDILEAYGGEGPGHPNAHDIYMITPHAWSQKGSAAEALTDKFYRTKSPTHMSRFGIPSTWYEAMHTYGCKITETDTIYYCDNIEVVRHPTLPVSKQKPLFFMLNLATGGGWPVDLSRYHGTADMYIDFVRVYQGKK